MHINKGSKLLKGLLPYSTLVIVGASDMIRRLLYSYYWKINERNGNMLL